MRRCRSHRHSAAAAVTLILSQLNQPDPSGNRRITTMPKFVIERTMPGAGNLSAAELNAASKVSNEALAALSPRVKWQQSYVTDDKIFCVYFADDPEPSASTPASPDSRRLHPPGRRRSSTRRPATIRGNGPGSTVPPQPAAGPVPELDLQRAGRSTWRPRASTRRESWRWALAVRSTVSSRVTPTARRCARRSSGWTSARPSSVTVSSPRSVRKSSPSGRVWWRMPHTVHRR